MSDLTPSPRRLVVDAHYLRQLAQAGATLSAEEWEQAFVYAGLQPILRANEPSTSRHLDARLEAIRSATKALQSQRDLAHAHQPLVPIPDGAVGAGALLGLIPLAVGATWTAGAVLVAVALVLFSRALPRRTVTGHAAANRAVSLAVQRFLQHTFVEAVGDTLVESVPAAATLRAQLGRLDETRAEAEARRQHLVALEAELERADGPAEGDGERARVSAMTGALTAQIGQVDTLRREFEQRLISVERELERMRRLAWRRVLSQRVAAAAASPGTATPLAQAEVEAAELDVLVSSLGDAVADAELRLRAALETAPL